MAVRRTWMFDGESFGDHNISEMLQKKPVFKKKIKDGKPVNYSRCFMLAMKEAAHPFPRTLQLQ